MLICVLFRFRMKYHPEWYNKHRKETAAALQKRRDVFSKLLKLNSVTSLSLDVSRTDDVVNLLDAGIELYTLAYCTIEQSF